MIFVGPVKVLLAGLLQSTWYLNAYTPSSANTLRSCVPPAAMTMLGAPAGGGVGPSTSAGLKKFTSLLVTHCSVAVWPAIMRMRSATQTVFWTTSSPVLLPT